MRHFTNRARVAGTAALLAAAVFTAGCAGNDPKVAAATVNPTVNLAEWKVAFSSATFKAGKVTFDIKNDGKIVHELIAVRTDLPLSKLPLKPDGDINEEDPSVPNATDGDNIDPGKAQTRAIDLTPGTYVFMCNLPGHFKAGMHEVITVTA
jgi:uncharacterized cupredoxin-like copper-binding protein